MLKPALILILAAVAAVPAAAAEPESATLTVSPADFASAQAKTRLDHRIRDAVESVCGSYSTAEVRDWAQIDTCWTSARAHISNEIAAGKGSTSVRLGLR